MISWSVTWDPFSWFIENDAFLPSLSSVLWLILLLSTSRLFSSHSLLLLPMTNISFSFHPSTLSFYNPFPWTIWLKRLPPKHFSLWKCFPIERYTLREFFKRSRICVCHEADKNWLNPPFNWFTLLYPVTTVSTVTMKMMVESSLWIFVTLFGI